MSFLLTMLWVIFIADAMLLVMIVLLQSGRGGGLSGMLGGGGGAESALGPKTGLPRITGWMAAIFFVIAILIGRLSRHDTGEEDIETGTRGKKATADAAAQKAKGADDAGKVPAPKDSEPKKKAGEPPADETKSKPPASKSPSNPGIAP